MSEIRGLVEYPVGEQVTQLFPGLTNGMTLRLTADSSKVWVGTTAAVKPGVGLLMNPLASVAWDANKPCYAVTEGPGLTGTLIGIDLIASVNDPTLLASLIAGGTVDATAIATAIAASGLTSAGIAAAITAGGLTAANVAAAIAASGLTALNIGDEVGLSVPSAAAVGAAVGAAVPSASSIGSQVATPHGTPVILQLVNLGTSVGGTTPAFDDVWVNGVHDAGGWSVPAGKSLRVDLMTIEVENTDPTPANPSLRLVDSGGANVYDAVAMRLGPDESRGIVRAFPPGAITVPTGIDVRVEDVTGATGCNVDVTVNGTLF